MRTKAVLLLAILVTLSGCGWTGYGARDNHLIGQVKKVVRLHPLICPDEVDADISLGVMRNGVGSLSTQDVWVRIMSEENLKLFDEAARTGNIVDVTYDNARARLCYSENEARSIEWAR